MRWTQAVALAGLTSLAQAKSYNNVRDQEIRDCGAVGCYAKAMQARAPNHGPRKVMARQDVNGTTSEVPEPVTTDAPATSAGGGDGGSTGTTTISVAYPTPTDYAAIFSLPAGSAIITEVNGVEIVLKNNGCFGVLIGQNPFTGNTAEDPTSGSASDCTGFCFGGDRQFSSNVQGDCYCGTQSVGLTSISESYCQVACPDKPEEFCGSDSAPVKKRQATAAAQVLEAVPRADVVIPGVDDTTTTGTDEATTTGTEATETATDTFTEEPTTTGTEATETATETATEEPTSSETAATTDTATEEPTSSETSSSATTTPSGTIPTDTPLIFGISRVGGEQPSNAVKRQTNTGSFVGGAGPVAPDNCDLASQFVISNGQLSSGGQFISTNPGVPYIPFAVSPTTGDITTTFGSDGSALTWLNDAFPGGAAGFCQDNTGRVYITFGTEPPLCTPVLLIAYAVEQCQNGVIVPPGPAPTTTALLPANETLRLPPNVFFPDAIPTGEACTWIQASWTIGEATITPFPALV